MACVDHRVEVLLSSYRSINDVRKQLASELRLMEAKDIWKAMKLISRVATQLDEQLKD